jgi:hypothetical protein
VPVEQAQVVVLVVFFNLIQRQTLQIMSSLLDLVELVPQQVLETQEATVTLLVLHLLVVVSVQLVLAVMVVQAVAVVDRVLQQ